jgi:hypothetical protein
MEEEELLERCLGFRCFLLRVSMNRTELKS